jgi:hypothetical protein
MSVGSGEISSNRLKALTSEQFSERRLKVDSSQLSTIYDQ